MRKTASSLLYAVSKYIKWAFYCWARRTMGLSRILDLRLSSRYVVRDLKSIVDVFSRPGVVVVANCSALIQYPLAYYP